MPNIQAKPIAILARARHEGFDHLFNRLRDNVAEYSTHKGEAFDRSGNRYLIIDRYEQLLGLEIKDFWIAPGFGMHPDAERMTQYAGERIRK
jgi:hypothetical protein